MKSHSITHKQINWHDLIYDRRVWGIAAIAGFIIVCTVVIIIGVQSNMRAFQGYPFVWPYGPYGPMPVP